MHACGDDLQCQLRVILDALHDHAKQTILGTCTGDDADFTAWGLNHTSRYLSSENLLPLDCQLCEFFDYRRSEQGTHLCNRYYVEL